MSEQSEHASDETEENVEKSKEDSPGMISRSEGCMLEDEEMPTYISVSTPSRREDSELAGNASQQEQQRDEPMDEDHSRSPYPSDDQGAGSVYVLSSGEDSDRPPYNEEDEDEYGDSEDMDDMDMENDHDNAMMDEEEEEDEEDEDNPLRMHNDDDEEFDGDIEPEYFERVSDDFVLNNRVKIHHKEKSLSLQDLSVCKNDVYMPYSGKRHSINIPKESYMGLPHNSIMYNNTRRKPVPLRYRHVESKVKRYIRDIKELNRRSLEKRMKEQEYKNHADNKSDESEQVKSLGPKTRKDYAEKALDESAESTKASFTAPEIVENGQDNNTDAKLPEDQYKSSLKDALNETTRGDKENVNYSEKLEKHNGSVDTNNPNQIFYPVSHERNLKFGDLNEPSLVNGHQQVPAVFNFRTLTYEEYIHGNSNSSQRANLSRIQEESSVTNSYNNTEIMMSEADNSNAACPLKIESVKSIRLSDESKDDENLNVIKPNHDKDNTSSDNVEVSALRMQLSQKDAQFNSLRDAYQKTLAENVKMKQELDALKKSLAKYEKENQPRDTRVAAVQTESVAEPAFKNPEAPVEQSGNKVSTSSVASTISSIHQWTDSTCSPAISMKPPDIANVLDSDDSLILTNGTPRKQAHPLSRAFITSSRILQTLSSITQGKAKPESPLVRSSKKRANENLGDQLSETENLQNCPSSSKKRKATDMLGSSTYIQPFKKIPPVNVESKRKSNSAADVEFKCPGEFVKSDQPNSINTTTSRSASPTCTEEKTNETDEQEDNVKCFVYHEDDNSKDRSFLIQAGVSLQEKDLNERGRIRECGPYLLGNVEVRMSEVNGTINIWGKEVSQETVIEDEEDEVFLKETKTCHCSPRSSQTRFNGSQIVCSTSKKSKLSPKFRVSSAEPCSHSASCSFHDDKQPIDSPFGTSVYVSTCENCNFPKQRKEWPTYKRISKSQERLHSCCTHVELAERECSCTLSHERQHSVNPTSLKEKLRIMTSRRSSCRNTPEHSRHLHENIASPVVNINEAACKYHAYGCPLHDPEENCQQDVKCCHVTKDSSTCKSPLIANSRESSGRHSRNRSPSNDGEEDPLIPLKSTSETPEARQRRQRGKKVRGILMDLLKGCGDCRNVSITNNSKVCSQEKETTSTANCPPQIKISPCTSHDASYSNHQCSGRCCHTYARIESQLEEFRMEMERIRSRSDAILDMLNMLHSVDMN